MVDWDALTAHTKRRERKYECENGGDKPPSPFQTQKYVVYDIYAMKVNINRETGINIQGTGDSLEMDGVDAKQYPFRDLWDDLQGTVHGSTGTHQSDLTYEAYRDTGFNMYFFKHNQDDVINIIYQMTHTWNTTTTVWPHMHVIPMAAGAGNAYFEVKYAWVARNSVLPAVASWTITNVTVPFTADDQFKHKIVSFGDVSPPVGAGASTMFLMKMTRLGTDPLDTYSTNKSDGTAQANLGVLYCDLHFQKTRAGTNTQYY